MALLRRLVLLGLLILALPTAVAQTETVNLTLAEGVWNGATRLVVEPGATEALLWVPEGARLHEVALEPEVEGASRAAWSAHGRDAIRVRLPEGAEAVAATYDYADPGFFAARYVAPAAREGVVIQVGVPEGRVLHVEGAAPGQNGTVRLQEVGPGTAVALRLVDADRMPEAGLVLVFLLLGSLVLVGGLAWHRARPPLGGREPERFMDHLAELQARLVPPAVAFALLNVVFFVTAFRMQEIRGVPLPVPALDVGASLAARAFDALAERLVPAGVQLVVLRPVDAVLAQVQMALFLAFGAVLPLLLHEAAAFFGPALMPRERRVVAGALPLVLALFVAGALFAFLVMAPLLMRTLYGYAPSLGAAPLLGVGDLVGFALLVMLAFGLAFELPVAMYGLSRLGVVQARTFRRYVRHAIVAIVLLAGILTPDPSVVSQLFVALPVTGLYVLGIAAAAVGERRRAAPA